MKQFLLPTILTVVSTMTASADSVTDTNGINHNLDSRTILLSEKTPDGPNRFSDPLKAIDHINSIGTGKVTMFVEPGVYWLDDPDDPAVRRDPVNSSGVPYAAKINCDTLEIIGLAENPEDVVFAVNRGQTQGALGNFTMLSFTGKSIQVENMTLGNYCNVDLVYPLDPSRNRQRRRDAIVQAQLGICHDTDRVFARNCRFISRLNLCPLVGANRSLYKDCYFECTDDALTGSAIYLDCKFTFHSGKPFYSTASTGAVFLNCDIHTLVDGTQYLTKVPGMVTMIDTRFTSDNPVTLQWTRDASQKVCYQSNISLNGAPVSIDKDRPELSVDLTGSPLMAAYKITTPRGSLYNIPNLTGGADGWDPLGMLPEIREAERELSCQLTGRPVMLRLEASTRNLAARGDTLVVTPSFRLWGDCATSVPGAAISWSSPSTLQLLSVRGNATAVSTNQMPRRMDGYVTAMVTSGIAQGLSGATAVSVAPYLKEAPSFISTPEIVADKTSLRLDYRLSGDEVDDSYIVWYRSTREDRADTVAVRHGHGLAARTYPLSAADNGFYLTATVTPKQTDTRSGSAVTTAYSKPVVQKHFGIITKREGSLSTSFAEIPIRTNEPGRVGFWHFDTYKPADTREHTWEPEPCVGWYYGKGIDAATGLGLVQSTKGARMSYTPTLAECKNMSVNLIAEPAKGPGQGFGSATGQYMDICIKFDPIALSGYALRIERTPDYDKAVTFTLVRYSGGTVTPVSESVASNCFRTPCLITLEMNGGNLTAVARTEAKKVESDNPAVRSSVMLTAQVEPVKSTSFAVQHTGSVGSSATLLRALNITWK